MINKVKKRYLILHPHLIGLEDRKGFKYILRETENGYYLSVSKDQYIGFPKMIVENKPELYKRIKKRKKITDESKA